MARNEKIGEKRTQLRQKLFPHIKESDLWLRKKSTGFTTIPRALPLLLALMDRLSKGKPVSGVYLELWCRMFDECFVNLKPREMAFHSGFSGQRAEQTWTERMKILQKLQFIETQTGSEGEFSYAVIVNPYKVIKRHFQLKTPGLDVAAFNTLIQRTNEIGATDLDDSPAQELVAPINESPKIIASKPPPRPPLSPPAPTITPLVSKRRKHLRMSTL
jgi:hypothetical protein